MRRIDSYVKVILLRCMSGYVRLVSTEQPLTIQSNPAVSSSTPRPMDGDAYNINVPPVVSLKYGNTMLTNASYHKDQGYTIFYGQNNTYIEENKTINVTCLAEGAKPQANITWMINGEIVEDVPPQVTRYNLQENRTFDSLSTLQFSLIGEEVDVTCHVSLNGTDIETSASTTFLTYGAKSHDFSYLLKVVVGPFVAAAIVTILLVTCVYFVTKRFKGTGTQTADLSASLQLALRDRPLNGVRNVSRDLPPIRSPMITRTVDENIDINCDDELGKCSTVTNVELGVHLPGEGTFQYWTASASYKNDQCKKIIAKCVSDSVQMKEHINFRTLAENLRGIKTHRNIIEILGVSIASVPYYIYMEYLEYGTLRDFLMRNYQQSRDSQSNIAQTLDERAIHPTGFALDVADGLVYLTDRDYHHPALCTRKVLVTKSGTCKLYDFWPKSLSTERLNQIFKKSHPPVAWLSPETIFLRQYFKKSDVWNFGVVLWEIYSLGEIPYSGLSCEEIEQEIRKMNYLDQPLTCPGGIFSMMLASWNTTVDERPDLHEWKQKLVCLLQSEKQELEGKNGTGGTGDQSYFTLESDICDYEDGYIEQ